MLNLRAAFCISLYLLKFDKHSTIDIFVNNKEFKRILNTTNAQTKKMFYGYHISKIKQKPNVDINKLIICIFSPQNVKDIRELKLK